MEPQGFVNAFWSARVAQHLPKLSDWHHFLADLTNPQARKTPLREEEIARRQQIVAMARKAVRELWPLLPALGLVVLAGHAIDAAAVLGGFLALAGLAIACCPWDEAIDQRTPRRTLMIASVRICACAASLVALSGANAALVIHGGLLCLIWALIRHYGEAGAMTALMRPVRAALLVDATYTMAGWATPVATLALVIVVVVLIDTGRTAAGYLPALAARLRQEWRGSRAWWADRVRAVHRKHLSKAHLTAPA